MLEVAVEVTNPPVQGVHLFGKITSPRGGNGAGVVSKPNAHTSESKTRSSFWTRVVDGFDVFSEAVNEGVTEKLVL